MAKRMIKLEEVERHVEEHDCWTVVHGKVYDITDYLVEHPGGRNLLFKNAGKDSTDDFEALFHSMRARRDLEALYIGDLDTGSSGNFLDANYGRRERQNKVHSVMQSKVDFKAPLTKPKKKRRHRTFKTKVFIMTMMDINHNTKLFRIAKPEDTGYKYPLAMHLYIEAEINGEIIKRPYTPTSIGEYHFDLVIKKYENGPISSYMHSLDIGSILKIIGPMNPPFRYKTNKYNYIAMIVCGTGITPVLPIIEKRFSTENDRTKMTIIYQNRTEDDILLKSMMADWEKPGEIEILHILSQPTTEDYALTGHIDDHITSILNLSDPFSRPEHFILCGTDGFVDLAKSLLTPHDITSSQITVF